MLYIFRLIITVIYSILVCVFGSIYCLFSPRNPKHVATFGHMFGRLAPLFGLKVECRKPADAESYGNAIYIANHQNNYDMVTASNIVQPPTVTVGKKSLLWIPFFGQLYWLTGNLLIDRNNRTKAHGTIAEVVNHFKKRRISIWMFPEGTRSRGRGLLPFKTGAFHAAIAAGVPVAILKGLRMGLFTGKTVIVTGGGKATLKDGSAGSIGYGIDIAFAKEGANLVITGRNVAKLEAAKESLEAEIGRAHV